MPALPAPRPSSETTYNIEFDAWARQARRARLTAVVAGLVLIMIAAGVRAVPSSLRPTLAPTSNAGVAANVARLSPAALGSAEDDGPGVPVQPEVPTATATTSAGSPISSATTSTGAVVVSALAANGIPAVALDAYERAAAQYGAIDPACHVSWPLLAAIGRVESDHGQFGGAVLRVDGTSVPAIIGRALNGNGTAVIAATPLGVTLDGDPKYDHAVGPMQIIPSTWLRYAVAATGRPRADPFNIYDAAVTAARYLCTAAGDLSTLAGQQRAVLAYNHSSSYVATVLDLESTYAGTRPNLQVSTTTPAPSTPVSTPMLPAANPGPPPASSATPSESPTPSPTDSPTPGGAPASSGSD